MKKLYILLALFNATISFAQPEFSGVTLPPVGTKWVNKKTSNVARPHDGANVTWDYSSHSFNLGNDVYEVVDINSIPSADYIAAYPECDVAIKLYTTNDPDDWSAFATVIINDTLYQGHPSSGAPSIAGIHPMFFFNEITYNSAIQGSAYNLMTVGYDSLMYSGYGTLKLDGKTYNNVAMLRGYMDMPYHVYRRTFWQTSPYFHLIAAYQEFPDNPSFPKTLTHFEVSNTVGVNGTELEEKLKMYPNPTANTVTLDNLIIGSVVFISDMTGKLLYSTTANQQRIEMNVSNFETGVYMVRIESNGDIVNRKLSIIGH